MNSQACLFVIIIVVQWQYNYCPHENAPSIKVCAEKGGYHVATESLKMSHLACTWELGFRNKLSTPCARLDNYQ